MEATDRVFRPEAVTAGTGLPYGTLKMWHRRYGLFAESAPERGMRRYTLAEIVAVRLAVELVRFGVAPRTILSFISQTWLAFLTAMLCGTNNYFMFFRMTGPMTHDFVISSGSETVADAMAAESGPVTVIDLGKLVDDVVAKLNLVAVMEDVDADADPKE